MIVDRINAYLTNRNTDELNPELLAEIGQKAAYIFDRQFGLKEERPGGIYLSSIGKCVRQQAYKLHDYPIKGKKLDSRSSITFFNGDMVELAVIYLAKISGCKINDEQKEVNIDGIKGHIDGIVMIGDKQTLLEVKSMSSYGFDCFEDGEIDESYIYQINAYMDGLGLKDCVMVALNKDSGVLAEKIFSINYDVLANIRKNIGKLKTSNPENLPDRKHSPNDKGYLPWQCLYCSYWGHCYPDAEKVLSGKSYKLKARV